MSWIFINPVAIAQERHPYQTPQAIALASSLQAEFRSANERLPLLDLIQQWNLAYSIPVWLDRRIPSDSMISKSDTWTTAGDSIAKVAEQIDADVAFIDGVVMLVPKGLAHHLENAYWSLTVSAIPKSWLRIEDTVLSWEDGAESTDVLKAFAGRFPLANFRPELLEHDVWAETSRNKTTPAVVAVSLLGNFDLQPISHENGIAVESIRRESSPEPLSWEYRSEIAKLGKDRWQQWRDRWGDAEVTRIGSGPRTGWLIRAPVAAHRELVEPLAPPPKKPKPPDRSNIRYSGRYRGELHAILKSLAKQRELELDLPNLPQPVLRQELDLVFEQATFEEILTRVGTASGLLLQRDGDRLRVSTP